MLINVISNCFGFFLFVLLFHKQTTFYLPTDANRLVHIHSKTTAHEVSTLCILYSRVSGIPELVTCIYVLLMYVQELSWVLLNVIWQLILYVNIP